MSTVNLGTEDFSAHFQLTPSTPGGLANLGSGIVIGRVVPGPTTGSTRGCSGHVNQQNVDQYWAPTGTNAGSIYFWAKYNQIDTQTSGTPSNWLIKTDTSNSFSNSMGLQLSTSTPFTAGFVTTVGNYGSPSGQYKFPVPISINTWYRSRVAWTPGAGGGSAIGVWYFQGSSDPTTPMLCQSYAIDTHTSVAAVGFQNTTAGGSGTGADYDLGWVNAQSFTRTSAANIGATITANSSSIAITNLTGISVGDVLVACGIPADAVIASKSGSSGSGTVTVNWNGSLYTPLTNAVSNCMTVAAADWNFEPAGIKAPSSGPFTNYVSQNGAGGGDGSTLLAAMTPTEFIQSQASLLRTGYAWRVGGGTYDWTTGTGQQNRDLLLGSGGAVTWVGDTVLFDSSTPTFVPEGGFFSGIAVWTSTNTASPATVYPCVPLAGTSYTQTSGTTNVWQFSCATGKVGMYKGALPPVAMGHAYGASGLAGAGSITTNVSTNGTFTTANYASIQAALVANPDYWWQDDAGTMYFSNDGTNPNTNGVLYYRGTQRNDAIQGGGHVHHLTVYGYCQCVTAAGAWFDTNANGAAITLDDSLMTWTHNVTAGLYTNKHQMSVLGSTSNGGFLEMTADPSTAGPGNTFTSVTLLGGPVQEWYINGSALTGNNNAWVSYNDGHGQNLTHVLNFNCRGTASQVGTIAAKRSTYCTTIDCHTVASPANVPFKSLVFDGGIVDGCSSGGVGINNTVLTVKSIAMNGFAADASTIANLVSGNVANNVTIAGAKGTAPIAGMNPGDPANPDL